MTKKEALDLHMSVRYNLPNSKLKEATDIAFEALREQVNSNEPLTLEELRQMGGEPVYVIPENPNDKGLAGWCVMYEDARCAEVPGIEYWAWGVENYGKTWTAYRQKPKEG